MVTQLRGRLVEKSPTSVVIDCQGVGYLVNISLYTFGQLTDEENIQLFTHLQVREDAHTLYGFTTDLERQLFRLLIGISGIGANTCQGQKVWFHCCIIIFQKNLSQIQVHPKFRNMPTEKTIILLSKTNCLN